MSEARLELRGVHRSFIQGGARIDVLQGVSLAVRESEIIALLGPSGSGKSTLLHIAGLLERADHGDVIIEGSPCGSLADGERTRTRRDTLGFIYQFHHLLPEFSALENVVLPQMIAQVSKRPARARARELLERFGLGARAAHRPTELSGGEQQRVAIARAVANRPRILLADEPTGNLDHATADRVFAELVALVRDSGLSALVATHNTELAGRMDRIVHLQNGVLVEE